MDSDWLPMFVSFISWKNCSENDSNYIVPLCPYHLSCRLSNYYSIIKTIFIVIVLGGNGSLVLRSYMLVSLVTSMTVLIWYDDDENVIFLQASFESLFSSRHFEFVCF